MDKKLKNIISSVLDDRTDLILEYKKGNKAAFNKMIAEILKKTKGEGDTRKIKRLLEKTI